MIEKDVLIVLGFVFVLMVLFVGLYVYMFLNVMRVDPREREFREKHGHDDTLVPHKYKSELEKEKSKNKLMPKNHLMK
jgi:hypothetical protein